MKWLALKMLPVLLFLGQTSKNQTDPILKAGELVQKYAPGLMEMVAIAIVILVPILVVRILLGELLEKL